MILTMKAPVVSASSLRHVPIGISFLCQCMLGIYLIGISASSVHAIHDPGLASDAERPGIVDCYRGELVLVYYFSSDVTKKDVLAFNVNPGVETTNFSSRFPPDVLKSIESKLPFNVTLGSSARIKTELLNSATLKRDSGIVLVMMLRVSAAMWTIDNTDTYEVLSDHNSHAEGNTSQTQLIRHSTVQNNVTKRWSPVDSARASAVLRAKLMAEIRQLESNDAHSPQVVVINATSCCALLPTCSYSEDTKTLLDLQRALCTPSSYSGQRECRESRNREIVKKVIYLLVEVAVTAVLMTGLMALAIANSCASCCAEEDTLDTMAESNFGGSPTGCNTTSSAFLNNTNAPLEPDLIVPCELFSPNWSKSAEVCLRVSDDLEELLDPELGLLTPEQYRQVVDERQATGDTSAMLLLHRILKRAGRESLLRQSVRTRRSRFDLSRYADVTSMSSSTGSWPSAEELRTCPPPSSPQPPRPLSPLTAFASQGSLTSTSSSNDDIPRSATCLERSDYIISADRVPLTGLERSCVAAMLHLEHFLELEILSKVQYLYLVDLSLARDKDSSIPWQAMHTIISRLGKEDAFNQAFSALFSRK